MEACRFGIVMRRASMDDQRPVPAALSRSSMIPSRNWSDRCDHGVGRTAAFNATRVGARALRDLA